MAVGRSFQIVTLQGTVTGVQWRENDVKFSGDALLIDMVRIIFEFAPRSAFDPEVLDHYATLPDNFIQTIQVLDAHGQPEAAHSALVIADPAPDEVDCLRYAELLESLQRIATGRLHPDAVALDLLERSYQRYPRDKLLRKLFENAVDVIVAHELLACDALLREMKMLPNGRM